MSSFFFWFNIRYVRYLMAIWYRCFISVLILFLNIFSSSTSLIGCLCIALLTPAVMVMRGLTCQPYVLSAA